MTASSSPLDKFEISRDRLPTVLDLLLAPPGERRANNLQIHGFLDYIDNGRVKWTAWHTGPVDVPTGVFLTLYLPGNTGIVMMPPCDSPGIVEKVQHELSRICLEELRQRHLHYAQTLLTPGSEKHAVEVCSLGFEKVATLNYLERKTTYPWCNAPRDDEARWVGFSDNTRAIFEQVIQSTYQDSADCPSLTGLRPMCDVIESHKASGIFTPKMWEIAEIDGHPAGCLLLSPLPNSQAAEVVYMGVVPTFRHRGIGKLLLKRAIQRCREAKIKRLTIVVDDSNAPAKRLYESFGLRSVAYRDAYLFQWT